SQFSAALVRSLIRSVRVCRWRASCLCENPEAMMTPNLAGDTSRTRGLARRRNTPQLHPQATTALNVLFPATRSLFGRLVKTRPGHAFRLRLNHETNLKNGIPRNQSLTAFPGRQNSFVLVPIQKALRRECIRLQLLGPVLAPQVHQRQVRG